VDIYASDEEKGEDIKRWWRENGTSVLAMIILAAAALFGGRYWQQQQVMQTSNASNLYQQTVMHLTQGQAEQAKLAVDQLLAEYASTPYATFAALEMAKQSVAEQQTDKAENYLTWVADKAELPGQKDIARLRLAKLLLQKGDYAKSTTVLEQRETQAFKSLYDEVLGDVLLAQNKLDEASSAYRSAMTTLDSSEPRSVILKLKLDDLAGS